MEHVLPPARGRGNYVSGFAGKLSQSLCRVRRGDGCGATLTELARQGSPWRRIRGGGPGHSSTDKSEGVGFRSPAYASEGPIASARIRGVAAAAMVRTKARRSHSMRATTAYYLLAPSSLRSKREARRRRPRTGCLLPRRSPERSGVLPFSWTGGKCCDCRRCHSSAIFGAGRFSGRRGINKGFLGCTRPQPVAWF